MRWIYVFLITILGIYSVLAQTEKLEFVGKVHFTSDASLEVINAESSAVHGIVDLEKKTFAVSVKINSFKGFNNALQKEHFNENYLESVKYPVSTYVGKLLDTIPVDKEGVFYVRTKGIFTIHGVSQERILKHTVEVTKTNISLSSNFSISLEDYNIAIPKIVHKKIAENIHIDIELNAKKQ